MPRKSATARLAAISKHTLDHLRDIGEAIGKPQFGTHAADILICMAVFMGHVEGRPMSPSKISTYLGIPRATVTRRLKVLRDDGLIELSPGLQLSPGEWQRPDMVALSERFVHRIKKVAGSL